MDDPYAALMPVVVVALVAALVPRRARVPQVVVLLLGGVLIGPQALDWSDPGAVTLLADLGLGFLFLLAGYELRPSIVRERAGRLAAAAWGTSLVLAAGLVAVTRTTAEWHAHVAVAIALTTTALGILLPLLRESGELASPLGGTVMAVGAVGELGPIVAMALLLGSRRSGAAAVLLVVIVGVTLLLAWLPSRFGVPRLTRRLHDSQEETGQSTVRLTLVLLVGLLAVAAAFGFDAVLGAFLGGMVLRQWSPGDVARLEAKLDVVAWGVFVPVFFVSSGMALDIAALRSAPWWPVVFLVLLLVVRGGPVLLWYRSELAPRERLRVTLYASTSLPLLVALTSLATKEGWVSSEAAAGIVGAGVLSVLVNPALADLLARRGRGVSAAPPAAG